jgi:hypothetical protein
MPQISGFMSGAGQRNLPQGSRLAARFASHCLRVDIMGRAIGAVIVALVALTTADHYFNFGRYTDAVLVVLRQIRHSFG